MKMNPLHEFLLNLITDDDEKKVLELILSDMSYDKIIDELANSKNSYRKKND